MRIFAGFAQMADLEFERAEREQISRSSRIYVDTNIFIYLIEGNPERTRSVIEIFQDIVNADAIVVTSEMTVAECFYGASKQQNLAAITAYEALFSSTDIEIIPLDGALAKRAAISGAELSLKLIDSLHYICALEEGCDFFFTSDKRFKSGPYLRVITP